MECYNCYYYESNYPLYFDPSIPEHPSCTRGSIPDESLKVNCSEVSFGGGGGGENFTYTCMDLTMDGVFNLSPIFTFNGTIRSCVSSYKDDGVDFTEECQDGKLGKVMSNSSNGEIQDILRDFSSFFNELVTDTHVCNCNQDLCNADE